MEIIKLDFLDLWWSFGIILMAVTLSRWQKLNLESQFIIASIRALIQLLFIGYILEFIFVVDNPLMIIFLLIIMITFAAIVTRNRISKKIQGLLKSVWLGLFLSSTLIVAYSIVFIIQPDKWYNPQYLIPLVGMVLSNTLNSASLAGERLASMINNNRLELETYLCLGASPQEAINTYRKEAIRIGLIPILNSMTVVGIVSLPGMFTGQVLAGNNPLDAASYQILILFMIALANLVSICLITEGVYRHFFNENAQLVIND